MVSVSQSTGSTGGEQPSRPPALHDESKAQATTTPTTGKGSESDQAAKKDEKEKQKEKRGEIVVAPLPMSSPALGTGIVPIFGYIFPFNKNDKVTPPSVVGAAGLITNGGSRALAVGGELYVKGGAYQVTGLGLTGHLNYNYYGTGTDAGNAGRKLAIQQGGQLLFGEILRRLGHKFYFGPRAWIAHSDITPNLSKNDSDHPDIPAADVNIDMKAFGFRLQ